MDYNVGRQAIRTEAARPEQIFRRHWLHVPFRAGDSTACLCLWAGTAARPEPGDTKPAPDPVRQGLDNLEEALHFAQEALAHNSDE
jgi:hypothetical protein